MKKFLLVLVGLGVVAAIVYLMGTDGGRHRRDDVLSRVRKNSEDAVPEIDLREQTGEAAESDTALVEDAATSKVSTST
jgi:hypothetical protein